MAAQRVRAKVHGGNLRLMGGYWVEEGADVPFGQGLARQSMCFPEPVWVPFPGRGGCRTILNSPSAYWFAGMDYFFTRKLPWCVPNMITLHKIV